MIKSKHNVIALIVLLIGVFSSCNSNRTEPEQEKAFDCKEYWLAENIEWEDAYDDVVFSQELLLLKNDNNTWAMLIPGSLTKRLDTISVNQESGYSIKCTKIGRLQVGDSKIIETWEGKKNIKIQSDTSVKFDNKIYKRIMNIKNGCSCDFWTRETGANKG